ncbi:MAG TPA: DEAD/DEAH box helicase [Gemmatimonadales bacterium]|nr:DEAD/DEAH box helicase [Gemmatimonadales bacterium]
MPLPDISLSRRRPVMHLPVWPVWPTIVAEALTPVAMPLLTALVPGAAAPPQEVAARLAQSLAPPEADVPVPGWLWPLQRAPCRRLVAAINRHGGAMLADPVGTGKTYVALAVAQHFNGARPTVCLVPAALRHQWEAAARRTGTRIRSWTHQRASRGRLPEHSGQLVVIDESHRFRNPQTRGYSHVAPWLLGHRTLLLSATPVVNRLEDLSHQLALAVRDDVLASRGVASVSALLGGGASHPALSLVVLTNAAEPAARPRATERSEHIGSWASLEHRLAAIDELRLSRVPAVATLLRSVFWRAAASSGEALAGSLRRYRRLLLHARDAASAGRRPTRQALLTFTGGLSDQLLMWELLPDTTAPVDLVTDDLPRLDALVADAERDAQSDDAKLVRLRTLLADGRRSVVFTTSRDTVRWLRDRLDRVAWCTGERAGIGRLPAPRRDVLAWFSAGGEATQRRSELPWRPIHLVATDVAAEGLDLQGAQRVIHYDLPWTPMRLEQRRGRIVRAGSHHPWVEVVRFEPPAAIEQRLGQAEVLLSKGRLPRILGLGRSDGCWPWRVAIAERFLEAAGMRGVAAVAADPPGLLAGFTVHSWRDDGPPISAEVLWWDAQAGWVNAPPVLARRLEIAEGAPPVPVEGSACREALVRLGRLVRERIRTIRRAVWEASAPSPAARALLGRLDALARAAARDRQADRLIQIQRAIGFVAGGHTAGEARELVRLLTSPDAELLRSLIRLPAAIPIPAVLEARVTGVILFLGGATFPPCQPCVPSCSTSMAP